MARPTKEQQEEKKRLEALNNGAEGATVNQEANTPNPGEEGVVGNGNTPGTNTHEGILAQQAEAEKEAGLNPVNEDKPADPLEINAEKTGEENRAIQEPALSEETLAAKADGSENQGINTADLSQANQESTVDTGEAKPNEQGIESGQVSEDNEEVEKVSQEDLDQYPGIAAAGIQIGDPKNEETFKRYTDFVEANPWYFPKDHPNYKEEPPKEIPVDKNVTNRFKEAGVEVSDDEMTYLKITGIIKDGGPFASTILLEDKFNDFVNAKKIGLPSLSETKHVYHGDFLTDGQLGETNITFDWDEVTAPDHLARRPDVPPPFTDGKKA